MIGIIFFCFMIAAVLAEKTRIHIYNKEAREKAIKKGKIFYYNNNGAKQSVYDNRLLFETNWGCGKVYVDANDMSKIIYDEGIDFLKKFNDEPYMKEAKGEYGFIYRTIGSSNVIGKRELFYFDKETHKPYLLFLISKGSDDINDWVYCMSYFKNDVVPNNINIQSNKKRIYDYSIKWCNFDTSSFRILTKNEMKYYDLDKTYMNFSECE